MGSNNRVAGVPGRWWSAGAACALAALCALATGAAHTGPEQDFADPDSYRIDAVNNAPRPTVIEEEQPWPTGRPSWTLKYASPRENAGARVTWSFPPQVLDGNVFQLYLRTHGTPVAYLTVRFR